VEVHGPFAHNGGFLRSLREEKLELGVMNGWIYFCEKVYNSGRLKNVWLGFWDQSKGRDC